MGILSACIGTQPVGTLWIGFLAGGIAMTRAMAVNALFALGDAAGWPALSPAACRGGSSRGRSGAQGTARRPATASARRPGA